MRYPWPRCCQVDALQKRFNDLGKGPGFVVPSPAKLRVVFCFGRPIIRIEQIKIMYRDFAYNTVTIHFNISIYLIFSMQIIGFMVYKKGLEFR